MSSTITPTATPPRHDFYQAFEAFTGRVQAGGALVACGDDPGAARLLAHARSSGLRDRLLWHRSRRLPCGRTCSREPRAAWLSTSSGLEKVLVVQVTLQVPGEHNLRNALAVLSVVDLLGLPLEPAAQALQEFRGSRPPLRGGWRAPRRDPDR